MDFILGWLVLAGVVAYIASTRGRLALDYFLLSAVLSPLVGLVILLTKRNLAEEARKTRLRLEEQERLAEASPKADAAASSRLVADELAKLAELRDKGVLTEDEFQARKVHLLR